MERFSSRENPRRSALSVGIKPVLPSLPEDKDTVYLRQVISLLEKTYADQELRLIQLEANIKEAERQIEEFQNTDDIELDLSLDEGDLKIDYKKKYIELSEKHDALTSVLIQNGTTIRVSAGNLRVIPPPRLSVR